MVAAGHPILSIQRSKRILRTENRFELDKAIEHAITLVTVVARGKFQ
jgi:hypothetical protein